MNGTIRTNQWLKDNFLQRDPDDYNKDLIESLSNGDWTQSKTQYYVDSTDSAASDTNAGTDPAAPLATIDGAFGKTLVAGDIVWVLPGHVESLADAQIDMDLAGVFVVGIGAGKSAPQVHFDHANASIDIGANNITVSNLRLLPSVTGVLIGVDVEAGVTGTTLQCLELMEGEDGAGVDEFVAGIDVKAGCHDTTIQGIIANSHASSAPVAAVRFAGASNRCKVRDLWAYGPYSTAAINNTGAACLNMELSNLSLKPADGEPGIEMVATTTGLIENARIASTGLALSAMIVAADMEWFSVRGVTADGEADGPIGTASDSADNFIGVDSANNLAATTNVVRNEDGTLLERIEDIKADLSGALGIATFPAAAAAANAVSIAEVLRYISEQQAPRLATVDSASPLTTGTLFTYTGSIEILAIIGRVTTQVQAQATTIKLNITPDALAAYDICTTVDANAFVAGTLLSITGTAANAMVGTDAVGSLAPGQANPVVATCVTSGVISVTYGAASTGAITWEMLWRPLSAGATVT
jgi:hypothetical protein